MKLFMSKEEKTGRALDALIKRSAEEANEMFDQALTEMKNGKPDQSNRMRKLGELSSMTLPTTTPTLIGYTDLKADYLFVASQYKHILYIGLVFQALQSTTDKYLSEEALKPFHHNSDLLRYFRRFSPAKRMMSEHYEQAEYYLLHGVKGYKAGDYRDLRKKPSFHRLMEARIELF